MNADRWLPRLYPANAALLCTHEIDSAYWKEWELFGLPGGIQLFLILNLVMVILVLLGYRQVLLRGRGAKACSILLSAAGLFAFGIHAFFLLRGRPEFVSPVSIAVLASILLVSLAQGFAALMPSRAHQLPH